MVATASPRTSVNGRRPSGEFPAPKGRSRRRPWVALALVLVPLSALVGYLALAEIGNRIPVLQAVHDIEVGQVVSGSDFQVIDVAVDGPAQVVAASDRDRLVGSTASARVAAGSLVSPTQFGASAGLDSGQVVVGAVLVPGELPRADLRVGDRVRLIDVAGPGGTAGSGGDAVLGEAEVFAIAGQGSGGASGAMVGTGSLFVSLTVGEDLAPVVAEATAAQRLRLVYLPSAGTEGER